MKINLIEENIKKSEKAICCGNLKIGECVYTDFNSSKYNLDRKPYNEWKICIYYRHTDGTLHYTPAKDLKDGIERIKDNVKKWH